MREHFPAEAGAGAEVASTCCGSWSNLQEPQSAPRRPPGWGETLVELPQWAELPNLLKPAPRTGAWGLQGSKALPKTHFSLTTMEQSPGRDQQQEPGCGWVWWGTKNPLGPCSGDPNLPFHIYILLLARLRDEGHGDGPVPDNGPHTLPLLLDLLLLVGFQALVVLCESGNKPRGRLSTSLTPSPPLPVPFWGSLHPLA